MRTAGTSRGGGGFSLGIPSWGDIYQLTCDDSFETPAFLWGVVRGANARAVNGS